MTFSMGGSLRHIVFAVASFISFAAPALGQTYDANTTADARCVIVGARLAASADPNERERAGLLMIYYIGKLDGRASGFDLKNLIVGEAARMTAVEYDSELRRCGEALTLKGHEITVIGNDLMRLGK